MEGHWASMRPGLLKNMFGVKVYMAKCAPICILTATITPTELATVKKLMGRRKEPLLVADGPVGGHTKICTIRRPSSDVDFLGRTLADGSQQPGILDLLRFLVLDRFLSAHRAGTLDNFPCSIVFFRWPLNSRISQIQIYIHPHLSTGASTLWCLQMLG